MTPDLQASPATIQPCRMETHRVMARFASARLRRAMLLLLALSLGRWGGPVSAAEARADSSPGPYRFDTTIDRAVLENYLARSITMVSPLDRKRWYHANTPSAAVPEGLGDEEAIRTLWGPPK